MRPTKTPQTSVLAGMVAGWKPCLLTWYDPALGGTNSGTGAKDPNAQTASGEPYDPNAYTCAAPKSYAFGTLIGFKYGGTIIQCRVNDRGGAISGDHFDLSRAAASALGIIGAGRVSAQFQIAGVGGAAPAANAGVGAASTSAGSGSYTPKSILDLLTAPTEVLGGWLAGIAWNLLKDSAEAVIDLALRPAWHWNQRAAMQYQQDMFNDKSGKQLLWTAAFWGGGYWLLFTDPNSGHFAPAPVRNSRLARHARFAQSIPARQSLTKPKDVQKKTPNKPKPIISRAVVTQTGTMQAIRNQPVKVTGTHARLNAGSDSESNVPVERENTTDRPKPTTPSDSRAVPNTESRTGSRPLSNRRRSPQGTSSSRERERR